MRRAAIVILVVALALLVLAPAAMAKVDNGSVKVECMEVNNELVQASLLRVWVAGQGLVLSHPMDSCPEALQ